MTPTHPAELAALAVRCRGVHPDRRAEFLARLSADDRGRLADRLTTHPDRWLDADRVRAARTEVN